MLLATDLDGTYLGGSRADRDRLYRLIDETPDITLAYVTGRGLEHVRPLLSDPSLARPDYVVCDVGATIVDGRTLEPVQPLQAAIDERWPGEQGIAEAMRAFPELLRQDVPQQRRCSYYSDPDALARVMSEVKRIAEACDCDLIYSASWYLDFLPRGINKGSTVRELANLLDVPLEEVLVAGDTLNDLSMYKIGCRGVCVGRSEPELLFETRDREHILHARRAGCGGILDALEHFDFVDATRIRGQKQAVVPGKADLVMLYHRLPYEEVAADGIVERRPHASPNGILPTLLGFFKSARSAGSWVAWSVHEDDSVPFEKRTVVDESQYPNLVCSRVPLSKHEVDVFYKRFSKEAFWPLLHTFWERSAFNEEHWQIYVDINRKFARHAAEEAADGALVWIHDYNLWMVPGFLRELRPDVQIAFFHHTYFPSADVFNVLPWRNDIIGSLMQCDYIGFHIPRQLENFIDCVRGVMPVEVLERTRCAPRFLTYGCAVGIEHMTTAIRVNDHALRLGAHPVGLDIARIDHLIEQDATAARVEELRAMNEDMQVILSVERLDFTKGVLQKLQAYEQLLDENPDLVGRITLIDVCVPAAREMTIYQELERQIDECVGRINGRFGKLGYTPVQFLFQPMPFEELVGLYAIADVMWITPLRDGLNLVAKEYVATRFKTAGHGVLVLSEFTGAAAELHGAILTNPHDQRNLVDAVLRALKLDEREARNLMTTLYNIIEYNDVDSWAQEFMEAARGACLPRQPTLTPALVASRAAG